MWTGHWPEGVEFASSVTAISEVIALKKATVSVSSSGASTIAADTAQMILLGKTLAQLHRVFGLAQELSGNLRPAVITTMASGIICVGGVLFLHSKILATVLLYNLSLVAGVANAMLPVFKKEKDLHERIGG